MNLRASSKVLVSFLVLLFACTNGQTNDLYEGKGGPVTNDGIFTEFIIDVSHPESKTLTSEYGLKEVTIDLTHDETSEIVMYLKSPDGSEVELTYLSGVGGKSYTNTCFTDESDKPIKCAAPPFTGKYRPVDYLGTLNNGQNMNGRWKLLIKDWKPSAYSGSLTSWKLSFGENAPSPVILKESNLPIIVISTNGQNIEDEKRILAEMGIITGKTRNLISDKPSGYNGTISIETRGSSSQNYSKKSYSFSITDSTGKKKTTKLPGFPEEKDWVLYAPYSDKSLLRNYLTYTLYRKIGHYSPRTRFVELVLNNDYKGVYMLTEKIKRNTNRINVSKNDSANTKKPDVTGGYIFRIDRHLSDEEGFYSSVPAYAGNKKVFFSYCYPDEKEISPAQKNYLKACIDSFENAVTSGSVDYKKYIDLKSFIDFFLINEFSKNVDAYKLSTYLYKDRDDKNPKIYIGPVWDYDLAWNNANYGNAGNPEGWQYATPDTIYPVPQWWNIMMNDPEFRKQVKIRWQDLRKNVLSTNEIHKFIDQNTVVLKAASERNFKKWPLIGSQVGMNPEPLPKSYREEIDLLKNWVVKRGAWMDMQIARLI